MKKLMKAIAALMLTAAVLFSAECMNAQTHKGHDYVDLDLPSGTLWATCNVGASSCEDYGSYFAWGETSTKSTYSYYWDTYKYANGAKDKLTKYCNKSDKGNNGFTDKLTTLQSSDDAATANWGNGWRTPSNAQWKELMDNTTITLTTRNGVNGRLFTAKNGNSLFLPAAGCHWPTGLHNAGSQGYYWSSSLRTVNPDCACFLIFGSGGIGMRASNRCEGFSVRPVREN